jgi:hypothetical protein
MSATKFAPKAQFDRTTQARRSMIEGQHRAPAAGDGRGRLSPGHVRRIRPAQPEQVHRPQLHRILDWLKSKGFQPKPGKAGATHPMARKARALWISLYQLGVVHNSAERRWKPSPSGSWDASASPGRASPTGTG